MEPRQHSADQLPRPLANAEVGPAGSSYEVASGSERTIERQSVAAEQAQSHQVEAGGGLAVPMPILPAPVDPQTQLADTAGPVATDAPIAAADEELIEKEWVDKAKQIINNTKDDPYQREKDIKQLQIDYVKKRYGRIIGGVKEEDA